MFRKFIDDVRGNFMIITAAAMVPLMGGLAFAIDFTELNRQQQATLNALDAAGIATGRYIQKGATEAEAKAYAQDFFEANLLSISPSSATLKIVMPNTVEGGGKLKLTANLKYSPKFYPVFNYLRTKDENGSNVDIAFSAKTEIRLKNTIEVAMVLDNSGSMSNTGSGSSSNRMTLLKEASTFMVEELARDGKNVLQVNKPVQVSLVPFSASVNIGPGFDTASWMDTQGISPVHHENFDWSQLTEANAAVNGNRWIQKVGDVYYKRGAGWNYTDEDGLPVVADGEPMTRFSLYQDMKAVVSREWIVTGRERVCKRYRRNGTCKKWKWVNTGEWEETTGRFASWQGCVEARPHPYNTNDATAVTNSPETLYVPMFAPDEPGNYWRDIDGDGNNDYASASWGYPNNYWVDSEDGLNVKQRQQDMRKYFMVKPLNASNSGQGDGPNHGCTTEPITPLTDVTVQAGLDNIKSAIDNMSPTGYTDVPQGIAWGWRALSSKAPFTEGRDEAGVGNDKVIIVLTDGSNTYRDLNDDSSLANNQSYYAAHGFTGMGYDGTSTTRLFKGTSVPKYDYSGGNYTDAHDEHMAAVCNNAKNEDVIIFAVTLDLPENSSAAAAMKACSSDSRFSTDENGDPKKLYYNTTGGDLLDVFKQIADELSNLRIVG